MALRICAQFSAYTAHLVKFCLGFCRDIMTCWCTLYEIRARSVSITIYERIL